MKKKKIISLALAFCIAAVPCFSFADSKDMTKEYKFTSDTDVITDLSYDAPEKIKEDGKTYKLKDIEYKVIGESKPLTEKKKVITRSKDDFDKKLIVKRDGKEVTLKADTDAIEWETSDTLKTTKSQEYKEGDVIPQSISSTKVDSEGNTVDITLNLKGTVKSTKKENFSTPAHFYSYTKDTRVYTFHGKKITVNENSPTWDGYKNDVAKALGLNGNEYTITGGSWTNVKKDGDQYVRTATYTGTRTMHIVTANYEETEATAGKEYSANVTYVEADFEPEYTVNAIASYKQCLSTAVKVALGAGLALMLLAAVMILWTIAKKRKNEEEAA